MAVDLGTGDGRHVLAAAAARPDALVIGADANAAAMAESSRRAARRLAPPNALFAVVAAEDPPRPLHGMADSLTVNFPWGSLLRGVLGHDDAVLSGLARLLAPGATGELLLSVAPRDGMPEVPAPDRLSGAYARHGLSLLEARPATAAQIEASGSSWAKRLRAGQARPVTSLRISTAGHAAGPRSP